MASSRRFEALWPLALSQIALIVFLAVCVAVEPGIVLDANEGGVSNYGVRAATVLPYTLAFGLCAVLLWKAARVLPACMPCRRQMVAGLEATAVGFTVVLASTYPYKLDRALDTLHLVLAVALFVVQFVFLTWMALIRRPSRLHVALWFLWFAGFALGGVTLAGLAHLLFVAQATMTVGFAAATVAIATELVGHCGADDGGL